MGRGVTCTSLSQVDYYRIHTRRGMGALRNYLSVCLLPVTFLRLRLRKVTGSRQTSRKLLNASRFRFLPLRDASAFGETPQADASLRGRNLNLDTWEHVRLPIPVLELRSWTGMGRRTCSWAPVSVIGGRKGRKGGGKRKEEKGILD